MTKTISSSTKLFQQLHVKLTRRWNDEGQPTERASENEIVAGVLLRSDLLAIVDYARRWKVEKHQEENLAEIGLRFQLTPLITLSAGTGIGIGDESPVVTSTLGMQVLF